MKIVSVFFVLLFAFQLHARAEEGIQLTFSAHHHCAHIPIDSVLVRNLDQGGSVTLFYPDTTLTLLATHAADILKPSDQLKVSQNYPNPFSEQTYIDVYLPAPDYLTLEVFNLAGRRLTSFGASLSEGQHHFTFQACNQQSYLLKVSSNRFVDQQLMMQMGRGGSASILHYNGISSAQDEAMLKDQGTDFSFEPGQHLAYTVYITDPGGQVLVDYHGDSPVAHADYFFDFENRVPNTPTNLQGENQVLAGAEELVYEVDLVEGLTYHWVVPADWQITGGLETHSIRVNVGSESGDVRVFARNACGDSYEATMHVNTRFLLTLTTFPEEGGTTHGEGIYNFQQWVVASAFPNQGYSFQHWEDIDGELVSTHDTYGFSMPGEHLELTAVFTPLSYSLTVQIVPEGAGEVIKDPQQESYPPGTEITLSAEPFEGYEFVSFTTQDGDIVSEEATFVFTVPDWDQVLLANFEAVEHELTVTVEPEEGGMVTLEPLQTHYQMGDEITLTATENPGYGFVGYYDGEGDLITTDAVYVFIMPGYSAAITAHFEQLSYQLVLDADPVEGGQVSGAGSFFPAAEVPIEAVPNEGFVFMEWTGDIAYMDDPVSASSIITMPAEDISLTAVFAPQFFLTLVANPEEYGIVEGGGIFTEGQMVPIRAKPAHYLYEFVQWESSSGLIHNPTMVETFFTMPAEDVILTARFEDVIIDEEHFYFVIETTQEQTQYSFVLDNALDFDVNWGNGHSETFQGMVQPSHDYGEAGLWLVKVKGQATRMSFYTTSYCPFAPMLRDMLTPVAYGISGITSAESMFRETLVESFERTDFFDAVSLQVTNMNEMFMGSSFDQSIESWDVGNVTQMNAMFKNSRFDQDISNWEVSGVETMQDLFKDSPFSQDISQWDVSSVTDLSGFLEGTGLDTEVYNELLFNWAQLPLQSHVIFHAGSSQYDLGVPADRRQYITNTFNWTIIDGGDTGQDSPYIVVEVVSDPAEAGDVSGSGIFMAGDVIQITASPAPLYMFTGWEADAGVFGDALSLQTTFTVPDQSVVVTAVFEELPKFQLSLTALPVEGGNLTGAGTYYEGESVLIAAEASPFYEFESWETPEAGLLGDESMPETTFIMPGQDIELVAGFEPKYEDDDFFLIAIETTAEQTEYRFVADDAVDLLVVWNDESAETFQGNVQPTFDFEEAGQWIIKVQGKASRIAFFTGSYLDPYMAMLRDISRVSDGITGITSAARMFERTQVEQFSHTDFFDEVSGNVTDMTRMFAFSSFNQDIRQWDVSNVTNMESMFRLSDFNQPLNIWQVSNVVNMEQMFYMSEFDQYIGSWDVSNVLNMNGLFAFSPFNHDIANWDVARVTDMAVMFKETPFDHFIGNWDVSAVTNMEGMFSGTPFNQDIGHWDVSQVTRMSGMFQNSEFNQDIGNWDVSNVELMGMYMEGEWMSLGNAGMFENSSFNQDIGAWDVSKVTNMRHMFMGSAFNQDIGDWDVSNVTTMNNMFRNSPFDQDIGGWDVSNVTDFTRFLFQSELSADNYNSLLIQWSYLDLKPLGFPNEFHAGSSQFDNGFPAERRLHILLNHNWSIIDGGSTGQNFEGVYAQLVVHPEGAGLLEGTGIYEAGQEINISATANPFYVFEDWTAPQGMLDDPLSANTTYILPAFFLPDEPVIVTANFTEVPEVTSSFDFVVETTPGNTSFSMFVHDAKELFVYWREGHVERFDGTRSITHDFEGPGEWTIKMAGKASQVRFYYSSFQRSLLKDILTQVSDGITGITSAAEMFRNTDVVTLTRADFLDDISENITDMSGMFQNALFNQDISHWDVSNVTNMEAMFRGSQFNKDISEWDVSGVENMNTMFYFSQFDQDISHWDVSGVADFSNIFSQGSLSTKNYNRLLIGWSFQNLTPGLFFDVGDTRYDLGFPQTRRQYIMEEFGWTINDGGDTGNEYEPENLTFNIVPLEGGFAYSEGEYHVGGIVSIFAVAAGGYEFDSWAGDIQHIVDPQEASTTLTMPADNVTLTANFSLVAKSCKCLLEDGVTTTGIHTILLDNAPTEVFCDMTSDGGGWTLVAVSAQGGQQWTWNNRMLFTTDRSVFGSLDDMELPGQSFGSNYKNTGLHDIDMTDVMIRWASDIDSKWASFHDVADGNTSLSTIIEGTPVSACAPFNQGYMKSSGDHFGELQTGTVRGYCGERLYFNLRNTQGSNFNCGIGTSDYSTYGPSFNYRFSHGQCTDGQNGPFNEPSYTGFGPCYRTRNMQIGVVNRSDAWADMGLSTDGQRRSMLLFIR